MKCQVDAIQWVGGGVVAEFFGSLQKPRRFSGGGGSSRIYRWSPKADAIQLGGVVPGICPSWALLHFGYFTKGGGPGPPAPPLNRPLAWLHH